MHIMLLTNVTSINLKNFYFKWSILEAQVDDDIKKVLAMNFGPGAVLGTLYGLFHSSQQLYEG